VITSAQLTKDDGRTDRNADVARHFYSFFVGVIDDKKAAKRNYTLLTQTRF